MTQQPVPLSRQDCALIADALTTYGAARLKGARSRGVDSDEKATRASQLAMVFHDGIHDPGIAITPTG